MDPIQTKTLYFKGALPQNIWILFRKIFMKLWFPFPIWFLKLNLNFGFGNSGKEKGNL